jgi:riboflavin biosynthesis pyrimidine reductase
MHRLAATEPVDDVLTPYRQQDRTPVAGPCWVLANMVAGLDGTAAVAGRVGALSGDTDADLFRRLRALADVVLVGAETVRRERYGPVRLAPELVAEREAAGRSPTPPIAVVSASVNFDWSIPLFAASADGDGPRAIVVTTDAAPRENLDAAAAVAEVILAGVDRTDAADTTDAAAVGQVDLPVALDALAARGATVVLCEGGPGLLGDLVAVDRLDELCLTLAPVMGGDALPIATVPAGHDLRPFTLGGITGEGDALFLRYLRSAGR